MRKSKVLYSQKGFVKFRRMFGDAMLRKILGNQSTGETRIFRSLRSI